MRISAQCAANRADDIKGIQTLSVKAQAKPTYTHLVSLIYFHAKSTDFFFLFHFTERLFFRDFNLHPPFKDFAAF